MISLFLWSTTYTVSGLDVDRRRHCQFITLEHMFYTSLFRRMLGLEIMPAVLNFNSLFFYGAPIMTSHKVKEAMFNLVTQIGGGEGTICMRGEMKSLLARWVIIVLMPK